MRQGHGAASCQVKGPSTHLAPVLKVTEEVELVAVLRCGVD
jgi:hypothetical protein